MRRPVFQSGRILRTSDFVQQQAYQLEAQRRHHTTLHTWGVASGLRIVQVDGDLAVETGSIVDGFGRVAILAQVHALDLRGFDIKGQDAVDVWIVYAQTRTPGIGDGVDLLSDSAAIELTSAADIDPRQPPGITAADIALAATGPAPDDPARRWPVYLGRITRDLTHPETPPIIDIDGRPYIGLVGSTIETPDGSIWLELTAGANPTMSITVPDGAGTLRTPLQVSSTDGVEVDARLTVDGELVVRGGALVLPPPPIASVPPATTTPDWSISHAEDGTAHELRIAMPPATGPVPNRLVVGVSRDGDFARSLVIDEVGTVIISGNLVVEGYLKAASVQEAVVGPLAKAYLAGLEATNLRSLFDLVPHPN